jgi:hypothetical protein
MATRTDGRKRRRKEKKPAEGLIPAVIRNLSPKASGAVMVPLLRVIRGGRKE